MTRRLFIESWKLRARIKEYKRHAEHSKDIIKKSLDMGVKFCLSWSGGKDSTVMTHLVRSLASNTPIITQFDDCDWPEKRLYIERVCKAQGWKIQEVWPDFSVWDAINEVDLTGEEICSQKHWITQEAFIKPLERKRKEIGCGGVYLGLRAKESNVRKKCLAKNSELYQLKNGQWRCCPLAWWTVQDVFAYLIEHEIEINPCYFNNRLRSPEEIRLSWALPTPMGMGRGDMEHIKLYYPEQYRRLQDFVPY